MSFASLEKHRKNVFFVINRFLNNFSQEKDYKDTKKKISVTGRVSFNSNNKKKKTDKKGGLGG